MKHLLYNYYGRTNIQKESTSFIGLSKKERPYLCNDSNKATRGKLNIHQMIHTDNNNNKWQII